MQRCGTHGAGCGWPAHHRHKRQLLYREFVHQSPNRLVRLAVVAARFTRHRVNTGDWADREELCGLKLEVFSLSMLSSVVAKGCVSESQTAAKAQACLPNTPHIGRADSEKHRLCTDSTAHAECITTSSSTGDMNTLCSFNSQPPHWQGMQEAIFSEQNETSVLLAATNSVIKTSSLGMRV
jgi:hypothetical protein